MPNLLQTALLAGLLAGSVTTFSCQKKPVVEPGFCGTVVSQAPQLLGRWELTQTSGGFAGLTIPADPAQRQELDFDANGNLTRYLNGTTACATAFSVVADTAFTTNRSERFLHFGTAGCEPDREYISVLSATDLVLTDDYADGQSQHYVRRSGL